MSLAILQDECKQAVSNLADLSNDELDQIMNDDSRIDQILASLDQSYLKAIQDEKDSLLASNNALAELNLSREPELVEGREKIKEKSEEGEALTKSVQEKVAELKNKGGDMSLETALALLQTAASESEEESDKIAKAFLGGENEIDDFLEQFLERRKLMHLRLVKAEKLVKILSRDPALNNIPSYVNAPPLNINTNYFPGVPNPPPSITNVPYPTGPLNMPMPNYFQNHY